MAPGAGKQITADEFLAEALMAFSDAHEAAMDVLLVELTRCDAIDEAGVARVRQAHSTAMLAAGIKLASLA